MQRNFSPTTRNILFAIFILAFLIRGFLIVSGGQYYWPDEHRYEASREAISLLSQGQERDALDTLVKPRNPLLRFLGMAPALIELVVGPSLKIPALFFSIFSVLNIGMIFAIIRALGGGEREALFGALLFSLSATSTYYSRHILPYDTALFWGLLSIWLASKLSRTKVDVALSGFFALAAFLTYGGYWLMSILSLLINLRSIGSHSIKSLFRKIAMWSVGFGLPLFLLLAFSNFWLHYDLIGQYLVFAGTVTQGSFSEGWSLPIEFFWHAEHFIFVFWIASLVYSIRYAKKNERVQLGIFAVTIVYSGLVLASSGLEIFVIYGRIARLLVPFLVILGAVALNQLWLYSNRSKRWVALLVVILFVQVGYNFYPILEQQFPRDFHETASKLVNTAGYQDYTYSFVELIYPEPEQILFSAGYRTVLLAKHPLEFLPYQYEGYTPDQRDMLRQTDISMRLVIIVDEKDSKDH